MYSTANLANVQGGDQICSELRQAVYESWSYNRDNRREALEDLRFVAGFQWSDAARAARQGRPMMTINRSVQFVRQVANPIRQNMPVIKVTPVDDKSDPVLADIYNGILRQIQYQSSATHVYASTVEHSVACGIGWFRIATDYASDEGWDQELMIKRIANPLSVYEDPAAVEPDRSDMGWAVVSEMMPVSTFKARYPGASIAGVDSPLDSTTQSHLIWNTGEQIRIAEYWKRSPEKRMVLLLNNGATVDPATFPEALIRHVGVARQREVTTHKVTCVKCSGTEQLEESTEWAGTFIPLVPVIGSEIPQERGVYRHGLIRFQREPQQMHNLFMSVAVETLGQAPKAPYLVTADMIGPYKNMWDTANLHARPYLLYKPDETDPSRRPERLAPPEFPQGLVEMANLMAEDMKATTGIYDSSLGNRSNETSGVAIGQRVQQGDNANAHYLDNLEHALDHAGRILVEMIPKIYDTQRTLRIVGEDGVEKWAQINAVAYGINGMPQLVNDLSAARFDVHVTIGKNYASRKQAALDTLMQFIQQFPPAAQVTGDLIAKNLDVEFADQLSERLKVLLPPQILQEENPQQGPPPGPPPPDPMQAHAQQLQIAAAEADTRAKMAQADEAETRAQGVMLDNLLKRKKLAEPSAQ